MKTLNRIWTWVDDYTFGGMARWAAKSPENRKKADRIAIALMIILSLIQIVNFWLMDPEQARAWGRRLL